MKCPCQKQDSVDVTRGATGCLFVALCVVGIIAAFGLVATIGWWLK